MIPLRDAIPAQSFPAVTVLLIALNVLAFLYELSLGRELDVFIMQYGAVPLRFILAGQMEQVSTVERFLPLIHLHVSPRRLAASGGEYALPVDFWG